MLIDVKENGFHLEVWCDNSEEPVSVKLTAPDNRIRIEHFWPVYPPRFGLDVVDHETCMEIVNRLHDELNG